MIEVRLPIEQWQQVLGIIAQAPWATANPLIMSIGDQLRAQAPKPNGVGEPNVVVQEPPTRQ
jgi:hypothetical protein